MLSLIKVHLIFLRAVDWGAGDVALPPPTPHACPEGQAPCHQSFHTLYIPLHRHGGFQSLNLLVSSTETEFLQRLINYTAKGRKGKEQQQQQQNPKQNNL